MNFFKDHNHKRLFQLLLLSVLALFLSLLSNQAVMATAEGYCIGENCIYSWWGTGTTGYLPRWTGAQVFGNSVIYQSGTNIGIGTTSPGYKLHIQVASNDDSLLIQRNSTTIGDMSSLYFSVTNDPVNYNKAGIIFERSAAGARGKMHFALNDVNGVGNVGLSDSRMTINYTGNVGIGTTSPAQKLHVAGYARADSGFCIGTSCITAWPQGEVTGSGTANYIPRWTTGSNVGNSVIYQSGSNIGIGTVSPGGKLEILQNMSDYGTAFTAPHLNLGAANTLDSVGFVGVTYDASTSNNYGWSAGALSSNNGQSSFVWKYHNNSAAGVERVRIDESGNIGISTTSPAQKLHVAGYARADSGFCIGTNCITAWPQGEVTGSGVANYIPRWTTSNSIGNSTIYQSGNNLGINKTNPVARLDINDGEGGGTLVNPTLRISTPVQSGSTEDAIFFYENGNSATGRQAISWYNGNMSYYKARIWTQVGSGYTATLFGIDTADDAMNLATRLAIRNGNVGIGTTSPAQKLHVAGYARADSGFCIGTSCITAWPQGEVTGSGTANYVPLWTTSSNVGNSVIYQSGSNIGIGTTSPTSPLHIKNDTFPALRLESVEGGKAGIRLVLPGLWSWADMYLSEGVFSISNASSATDLNIAVGGIGIGTTSPQANLDVRGRMHLSSSAGSASLGGLVSSDVLVMPAGASIQSNINADIKSRIIMLDSLDAAMQFHSYTTGTIGGFEWGGFRFYANDDEVFTIQTTADLTPNLGFVGINNSYPSYHLDVNGSVRADEYYYSSDASLKTGIGYLPGDEMLSKVLKLQGVSFNWKENGQPSIGFIAQDVEKIFPELVKTDQDGIKSIQYGNLIAPLVEAIKEQQKQIEQLRQEVEELKK